MCIFYILLETHKVLFQVIHCSCHYCLAPHPRAQPQAVDVPPPTTVTAVLRFIIDIPGKIADSIRMSNGIVPVWRGSWQYLISLRA